MLKVLSIEFCQKRKEEAATKESATFRQYIYFRTDCFFCGKTTESKQFIDKRRVSCVRTLEIKSTRQDICAQRNDSWSLSVMARIEYSQDLPAFDIVYHRHCT